MLTTTATFDKYKMRPNAKGTFIIKVTGDISTFYISDRVIDLSDSSIKTMAVVKSFGDISQKIDLFTKKVSISNVKLKLINAPYFRESSAMVCLSDRLGDEGIVNVAAEIYYWFEGITSIDDCLKIFDGLVQPIKKATPETLDLEILDNSIIYHKIIPSSIVNISDFPNVPFESIGKPLPLVYGNFDIDTENFGSMAEGIWIEGNKIAFASHVLNSISSVWVFDEILGKLVKLESTDYTISLDDNGISTVTIDDMNACDVHFYHLPNREEITQDANYPNDPFHDMHLTKDQNLDTAGDVERPDYVSPYNTCDGSCKWYFSEVEDAGTIIGAWMEVYYHKVDASEEVSTPQFTWPYGVPVTIDCNFGNDDQWKAASLSGFDWADFSDKYIYIYFDFYFPAGGSGHTNCNIKEVRVHVQYTCGIQTGWRVFAECRGRKFGSWIDEGGRSNIFDEGDMIENPAYIAESILRDEMGLSSNDIDTDSFDDVWGGITSWDLALNVIDFIGTDFLFLDIGLQSKCHIYFDSQGLAKIALIDDTVTSEDDSLVKNDIALPHIEIDQGDIKKIINSVDILYAWHPVYEFQSTLSAENTTSQTDYNITKHKTIEADFIQQAAVATLLKNHIVGTSGYWKDLQEGIEIDMLTFDKIHWEIGDRILPDSSLNDIYKLFGDDFGSATYAPLFIIIEKKIGKKLSFTLQRMGNTGSGGT